MQLSLSLKCRSLHCTLYCISKFLLREGNGTCDTKFLFTSCFQFFLKKIFTINTENEKYAWKFVVFVRWEIRNDKIKLKIKFINKLDEIENFKWETLERTLCFRRFQVKTKSESAESCGKLNNNCKNSWISCNFVNLWTLFLCCIINT